MENASARRDVLVAGWTEPRGSRPFFGSLLLVERDPRGGLHYIGQVRSGFRDGDIGRIWSRLQALRTRRPAFLDPIIPQARWIKPGLEILVTSRGWTRVGTLRHPLFAGMREDRREASHTRVADKAARTTRHD